MLDPLDGISRRAVLRALFYGGAAWAAPLASRALGTADATATPELSIAAGPLSRVGGLVETGVDNILAPRGFALRAVARHRFNPVTGWFDPFAATGYAWHKAPDGGACFPADDGGWVYVSNCESKSSGGAGALRFAADGSVTQAYRVLDNTRRNCAGGATPWNTWLSCEETGDGQVYECDPFGDPGRARELPALGRFNHEAAAVDLPSRSVLMTEDAYDGRLYRFLADAADVADGGTRLEMRDGRLQVLNIQGFEDGGYTADVAAMRTLRRTRWVDALDAADTQSAARAELAAAGARCPGSIFRGAEGLWIQVVPPALRTVPPLGRVPSRAFAFFACKTDNRVYALDLDNDLIEVVFDNASIDRPLKDVDNLVVGPAGDIVVTEDGDAMRLVVIAPNRPARTLLSARHPRSELTGPAFSPDGSRLYFSSQRGPNLPGRERGSGVTYELTIPREFRHA